MTLKPDLSARIGDVCALVVDDVLVDEREDAGGRLARAVLVGPQTVLRGAKSREEKNVEKQV